MPGNRVVKEAKVTVPLLVLVGGKWKEGAVAAFTHREVEASKANMSADEELARRLDQQLNRVPAAASGKRTRRVPDFYTPEVPGSNGRRQRRPTSPMKDDSDASSRDDSWKPDDEDDEDDADFKPEHNVERKWEPEMSPVGEDDRKANVAQRSESIGKSQDEERTRRDRKSKGLRELQALINDAHKEGSRQQQSGRGGAGQESTSEGEESESSPSHSHSCGGICQSHDGDLERETAASKERMLTKPGQSAEPVQSTGLVEEQQRLTRALRRQSQNGVSTDCLSSGAQQKSSVSGGQRQDAQKQGTASYPRKRQRLDDAAGGGQEPTRSRNTSTSQGGDTKANGEKSARKPDRKNTEKFPRMPMVLHGKEWYRARILKEDEDKIFVEFTGFEDGSFVKPFWLSKDSDLVWRGSYRGKDWKYLGDGAWEPRTHGGKKRATKRGRPCPQGRRRAGEDDTDDDSDPKQNGYTEETPQCMLSVSHRPQPNGREEDINGSENAPVLSQTSDNEDKSQSRAVGGAVHCNANIDGPSSRHIGRGTSLGNGCVESTAEGVEGSHQQETEKDSRREKENHALECEDGHLTQQANSVLQRTRFGRRDGDRNVGKEAAEELALGAEEQDVPVSDVVVCRVVEAEDTDVCGSAPRPNDAADGAPDRKPPPVNCSNMAHTTTTAPGNDCNGGQKQGAARGAGEDMGVGTGTCRTAQMPESLPQQEGQDVSDGRGSRDANEEDSNGPEDGPPNGEKKFSLDSGDEEAQHSGREEEVDLPELGIEGVSTSAKAGVERSSSKGETPHGDTGDGEEGTWEHVRRSERVKRLGWKGAWKRSCKTGNRSGNEDEAVPSLRGSQPASPGGQQQGRQQRIRTSKRIAAQAAANEASKKTGSEAKALVRTKSGALKRSLSEVEPVKSPREGVGPADPLRQRSKSHRPKSHRAAPSCSTPNRGYTPMVGRSMTHALALTSQALHWTAHNAIQRHIRKHLPYYTGHISDEKLGAFVELMEHLDGAMGMGQTNSGAPRSTPSHGHPDAQFAPGVERDGGQPRGFSPAAGNVQGSAGFRQGGQGPIPLPWGTMSPMIYPVVQFPMSVPGMELLHRPTGGVSTSQPGAQASQALAMPMPQPPGSNEVHTSTAR
ncbi:unnamed protein product [Ostreobium quekettii]|uniref:Uncharacterized protein n=1 Tax=Ostreobium quekettii TaxID=121088 RepID=A0A8S1IN29_9CHLO|nr:unnamed protein product [Ostreobium quekettii]|eukprot:evm.model.scf_249.9 EVM.evm.TU.scf_249.9   scf_249:57866-67783(-)